MRRKGKVDQICDEVSLKVWPAYKRQPLNLRTTKARRSLWKIYNRFGEGHLRMVLIATTQTTANEGLRIIPAPILLAVSDVLMAHPEWENDFMSVLDGICLKSLYEEAKALRMDHPRKIMRALLGREVRGVLER